MYVFAPYRGKFFSIFPVSGPVGVKTDIFEVIFMQGENWVRIDDFPEYFVNRSGEFKKMIPKGRLPAQAVDELGNPTVALRDTASGEKFTRRVDRIVARAFVDPGDVDVDRYPTHIDGDPGNCHASNLRWE